MYPRLGTSGIESQEFSAAGSLFFPDARARHSLAWPTSSEAQESGPATSSAGPVIGIFYSGTVGRGQGAKSLVESEQTFTSIRKTNKGEA